MICNVLFWCIVSLYNCLFSVFWFFLRTSLWLPRYNFMTICFSLDLWISVYLPLCVLSLDTCFVQQNLAPSLNKRVVIWLLSLFVKFFGVLVFKSSSSTHCDSFYVVLIFLFCFLQFILSFWDCRGFKLCILHKRHKYNLAYCVSQCLGFADTCVCFIEERKEIFNWWKMTRILRNNNSKLDWTYVITSLPWSQIFFMVMWFRFKMLITWILFQVSQYVMNVQNM